jgi:hypothetical protein
VIEELLYLSPPGETDPGPRPPRSEAWVDPALLDHQAQAIDRTSRRLGRLLEELRELEAELDELDRRSRSDELCEEARAGLTGELELAVDSYNHLREAADCALRQLVLERESCGFRGHEVLARCYPIPDLVITPELVLPLAER